MASFRCYDNSDVVATLITTNFHLYLIQLWWQFLQMFVYGDVVYAQTWHVLTLKNCIEPFSYASTAYVVASALVSVLLFCKNLSNLQKFFRPMVYRPPWQRNLAKNSPYAYALTLCLRIQLRRKHTESKTLQRHFNFNLKQPPHWIGGQQQIQQHTLALGTRLRC